MREKTRKAGSDRALLFSEEVCRFVLPHLADRLERCPCEQLMCYYKLCLLREQELRQGLAQCGANVTGMPHPPCHRKCWLGSYKKPAGTGRKKIESKK